MSNCKSLNLRIYTDRYELFNINILSPNINGICRTENNFIIENITNFNITTEREKIGEGVLIDRYKIQLKDNQTSSMEDFSLMLGTNKFCDQNKIVSGFGRILMIDLAEDLNITSSNVDYKTGETSLINSICPSNVSIKSSLTPIILSPFYYHLF